MGHIRETIHVDAPIEQVWDLGAKCDRYTEWQTGIVEVKGCTSPMDHVGAKYTAVYKAMGRSLEVTIEVNRAEKPGLIENKFTVPGGGHGISLQTAVPAGGGVLKAFPSVGGQVLCQLVDPRSRWQRPLVAGLVLLSAAAAAFAAAW